MQHDHTKTVCEDFQHAIDQQGLATLGVEMLNRFFKRYPEAIQFFEGIDINDFAASKFRIIRDQIIDSIKRPEHASYNMFCEIHRHSYLEIRDIDYHYALLEACREAVEYSLANEWTQEKNDYWNDVIHASKAVIQQAWKEAQQSGL